MGNKDGSDDGRAVLFGQEISKGILGRGPGNQRPSVGQLTSAANIVTRFPEFGLTYNRDTGLWRARVKALTGMEVLWDEAEEYHQDPAAAVVELATRLTSNVYVAFREKPHNYYAKWDPKNPLATDGWLVRPKSEVEVDVGDQLDGGAWSRVRPPFMKPGHVWPGPAAVPAQEGLEETTST